MNKRLCPDGVQGSMKTIEVRKVTRIKLPNALSLLRLLGKRQYPSPYPHVDKSSKATVAAHRQCYYTYVLKSGAKSSVNIDRPFSAGIRYLWQNLNYLRAIAGFVFGPDFLVQKEPNLRNDNNTQVSTG